MKNLENILSHSDCLTQEQMQSYLANALEKEQILQIENHITDCMFCSDALEGLQLVTDEESAAAIGELKNHFDGLLFAEDEEKEAAPLLGKKVAPEPKLTAKKGGRKIGLAAAAGLFFLIFGAGLAVFSYINNNTNWLKKAKTVATTKGDGSNDLSKSKETKSTGRELETYSLTESELDFENEAISSDANGDTKKEKEKNVKSAPSSPAVSKKVVARNSPPINASPALAEEAVEDRFKEKDKVTVAKNRTSAPKIAKTEKADASVSYNDLSTRNAYEIPKYEGKLKDKNAPAVSSVKRKKQERRLEDSEMQEIDAVQSTGKYSKKGYVDNTDNYTKGNKAYDQGDYKQSIKLYKRALRQKDLKNRNEVMYQLALAYEKTDNQTKAEDIFGELEKIATFQKRARSGLQRVRSR